jgi:hypothetical protein
MKCYQACVHDYIHACPNAVDFDPKLLCCELNAVLQGPDVRVRLGGSETYIRNED